MPEMQQVASLPLQFLPLQSPHASAGTKTLQSETMLAASGFRDQSKQGADMDNKATVANAYLVTPELPITCRRLSIFFNVART